MFLIYTVIREVLHYKQMTRLQELLKSSDINEYYTARKIAKVDRYNELENDIVDEPNEYGGEPEIDYAKITKVVIDGQEKPINIL